MYVPSKMQRRFTAELAVPIDDNSPNFIKLEVKQQNLFKILPGRINLVTELNAGCIAGQTF